MCIEFIMYFFSKKKEVSTATIVVEGYETEISKV